MISEHQYIYVSWNLKLKWQIANCVCVCARAHAHACMLVCFAWYLILLCSSHFHRLILEAPVITENAMQMIRRYCFMPVSWLFFFCFCVFLYIVVCLLMFILFPSYHRFTICGTAQGHCLLWNSGSHLFFVPQELPGFWYRSLFLFCRFYQLFFLWAPFALLAHILFCYSETASFFICFFVG